MNLDKDRLHKALSLLGQILEREHAQDTHFVVCGGSALIMRGLISRMTRDVDIIAFLSHGGEQPGQLHYVPALPGTLSKAASQVASDLGLDKNWLNTWPKDLLQLGLPEGFSTRLDTRSYSKNLFISFISRFDQIHFKVYAAVDSGPGRHVDDLMALAPNFTEMKQAAMWAMRQDPSPEFKATLLDMLNALHYERVAEKLQK